LQNNVNHENSSVLQVEMQYARNINFFSLIFPKKTFSLIFWSICIKDYMVWTPIDRRTI